MQNCVILYLVWCQIHHCGNIVQIRSEDDEEILKNFTQEQKNIRWKYRNKLAKKMSKEDYEKVITEFQKAFKEMAGDNKW